MSQTWLGPRALADATSVSTDTLRHYERLGLLPGVTRTPAGYRRYPPMLVDRVRVIQQALAIGFSLQDLASVLRQRDRGGAPPCQRVRTLCGERLAELNHRIDDLTALRADMQALVRDWDRRLGQTPAGQPARLLDMLARRDPLARTAWRARGRKSAPF